MTYASYVQALAPEVRLLIALIVTVGLTLAISLPLRKRAIAFAEIDSDRGKKDDQAEGEPAEAKDPTADALGGKVLGFVTTAFVFLLAFTLSQMWSNASDAQSAAQLENAAYARAVSATSAMPAGADRDQLFEAIQGYRDSIISKEWPNLEQADRAQAVRLHAETGIALGRAVDVASQTDLAKNQAFGVAKDSIDEMVSQGTTRISQVPGRQVPGLIIAIFLLGIAMLGLTAFFFPTRARPYALLLGSIAALTALLLFLLLETTNPFIGAGAVPIPTILTP